MPQKALPIAPVHMSHLTLIHREYLDLLGRPMKGTLTVTATMAEPCREGDCTIMPVEVRAPVVDGVLSLELPPGCYTIEGDLWTVDDTSIREFHTVMVGE